MPRRKSATQPPSEDASATSTPDLDTLPDPAEASTSFTSTPRPRPVRKQYRVSHRDIEDYPFTEEQVDILVSFIREHPCLYDKRDKLYANNRMKLDLWHKCSELFQGATYLQCRKYFEQKRTAFGKIEAQEQKSGAEARPRTLREEIIMETWAFLGGHIAHAATASSQRFSSGQESSSNTSEASGLSAASIARRKTLKKRRLAAAAETSQIATEFEKDPDDNTQIITSLLARVDALTV